jgi:hypothetical protein
MVRTALCDESGTGSGLGGYDFSGLFGMTQDSVPFQCRKRCDGTSNKMTLEMKIEPELAMYTNTDRSFDSGYCNGPFACDVHSCVIFTPSNDWDAAYMQASACPVYIDARLENKLWATPDDPNLLDAIDSMRRTKCSSCERCGHDSPSQEDSQAMQGYATWGVGCVRECSETLCGDDQVWDWTEPDLWSKCKLCTALSDVRLCLTKEQQYFVASDVSGNLPKIYFDGCHGKSTNTLTNRVEATYGTCVACPADDNLCASSKYYKTCGWDDEENEMTAVCEDCRVTSSVTSYYFNGSINRNVYCQKAICGKDRTGVTIDVTPHITCNRRCQTVLCVPGQVLLPCVLPHYARCVWAVHGDQHVQDLRYVAHAHSPGHANMLEPVDATNMFSSFENVLLSVDSVDESRRRVCVWNADDIVDNGMNPGGVSVAFDGECRPWSRDPATEYPLLPMQNTVIEREVTFYRRILLNTSACAAHYSSEWRGMPREYGKSSIPGAFSGDVFLDLDLTNTTNATLAAFVPDDRGLGAVTSISRWRVSVYTQQTLGDPSRVRIDTDTGIEVCDECFHVAAASTTSTTPAPTTTVTCSDSLYTSLYTTYKQAWSNFNGDKFLMTATHSTFVCDKATHERIQNLGPPGVVSHHTLAVLAGVVSELTDSTYALPIKYSEPERLIGSSGVISGLACMTVVFSSNGLYCLSVDGVITALRGPDAVISALCDVVQSVVSQSDSILATYTCGDTRASLCFNLNSQIVTSFEDRDDIVMHASVVPEYYLSRNDNSRSIVMKAFRCSNVCALQCTSDDVSRRIELSFSVTAANTFFSGNKQIVVLATSARNADAGVTYVFMARQGVVSKYTMHDRGTNATEERDWTPDDTKMRESAMSGAWISETTFILSFEDPRMIWQCTVDYSSITVHVLKSTVGSPQTPFFRVGAALLSYASSTQYTLQTWMPACTIQTTDTSAYFAFGSTHLTYTRLRPCGDGIHYIDPSEWTSQPVHTCVSACWNSALRPTEYQVAMRCKTPDRVSIMSLALPPHSSVTFDEFGITNTAAENETVVVYTQCRGLLPSRVFVAGGTRCAGVCEIQSSSRILLGGGVSITFVVEAKMQPTPWHVQAMLGGSAFWSSAVESLASHGQWSQPHVFVHNIQEKQPIFVNVVRTVTYASLVDTLIDAKDTEMNVALDVLEVIPSLSERAVLQVWDNRTLLFTVLLIPSDDDLALLSLQAFKAGHDVLNWRRLHAVAYIRSLDPTLAGCVYDLRLIEINASFVPSWPGPELGCAMHLPGVMEIMTAQCHLEIPYAMANTDGLVGVYVSSADGQACPLPHPESLSLELAPFVAMQNCTQDAYLHAGTGKCVSCESSDKKCGVGFYAPACEALLPASRPVNCSVCPAVANSGFLPTSANCDDWTCLGGFYNSDGTCIACTSDLVDVCGRTPGLNWSACTTIRNEDCRACDDLRRPRYAEWTNHSTCSWRCRDAYFESGGQCYACMSLDMLKVVLEFGGDRSASTFYKFEPCNASHQSRFTPCVQSYLGNGVYTADAAAFLQHCPATCTEDRLVHLVATSFSDSDGLVWDAQQCVLCAHDDMPTFPNGSMLPAHAFSMNLSCHAACLPVQGFYAARNTTGARTSCVHCPDTKCAVGEYLSTSDDCSDCHACASRVRENVVFTSSGRVDTELSCAETCKHGYFYEGSSDTCLPHANRTCTLGLQYKVNGTAFADTRCEICTDCLGNREVRACSAHEDAECESCGELVWWNSHWSGVDCLLECKPSFTKLFRPERCQQCSTCPEGSSRPSAPDNCSQCLACEPPKPESASYLQECTWRCPDFFSLVQTDGISDCLYAPGWITSDSVAVEPPATELVCAKGFRLENFACTECDTPAGLSNATLGDTWFWVASGCAWECTPERSHFTNTTTKTHSCLSVPAYRQAVLREVAWRRVQSETGQANASSGDANNSQNRTAVIQGSGGNGSVALVLFATACALLCILSCFSLRVRHRYGKLK